MFLLVFILVFATNWQRDFSLFKLVLDWHSLPSLFYCKSQENISFLQPFTSSPWVERNCIIYYTKRYCLKKQRSFQAHKTFFRSMMKTDLELIAAAQPWRLSLKRDFIFFLSNIMCLNNMWEIGHVVWLMVFSVCWKLQTGTKQVCSSLQPISARAEQAVPRVIKTYVNMADWHFR